MSSDNTKDKGKKLLRLQDLNHMERIQELVFDDNNKIYFSPDKDPTNYKLENFTIAETGFNLFILKCYIEDYYKFNKINYDDKKKGIEINKRLDVIFEDSILSIFVKSARFIRDLFLSIVIIVDLIMNAFLITLSFGKFKKKFVLTGYIKNISSRSNSSNQINTNNTNNNSNCNGINNSNDNNPTINNNTKSSTKEKNKSSSKNRILSDDSVKNIENIEEAYEFYQLNTRSIEILRDEKVYKLYFYLRPYKGDYTEVI